MKELLNVHVANEYATEFIDKIDCDANSFSRASKVSIGLQGEKFDKLRNLYWKIQKNNGLVFGGWEIKRSYSTHEKQNAEYFHLTKIKQIDYSSEEFDTRSDKSSVCKVCGLGEVQTGSLRLPVAKLPKNTNIFRTLDSKLIVDENFTQIVREAKLSGIRFESVVNTGRALRTLSNYYQVKILEPLIPFDATTVTGNNPFDFDVNNEFRCSVCRLAGLSLISEMHIQLKDAPSNDFSLSREFIGINNGFIRPARQIIVSKKAFDVLQDNKIKGGTFEIVRLVSG